MPKEEWVEPDRKGRGPTLTARAAAKYLGFSSTEAIHVLVRRSPEEGGIPAYKTDPESGIGWRRKGTAAEEKALAEARGEQYNSHAGSPLMFYQEDLDAWMQKHPLIDPKRTRVQYTQEQYNEVIAETTSLKEVRLPSLYDRLVEKYGLQKWNMAKYNLLSAILDDAKIAYIPYTQEQYDTVVATAEKFRNEKGYVIRSRVYKFLQETEGVSRWNTRTYRIIQRILNDAGFPITPQMKHASSMRRKYANG